MSSRKVKIITRVLECTSVVRSGTGPYTYTCTTTDPHFLNPGDNLNQVLFNNFPQQALDVATIAGTTGNTVVFQLAVATDIENFAKLVVNYYSTGQTGVQEKFTLPLQHDSRGILQTYVEGTGGASYTIEVSLNGVIWETLGSAVTHAGTAPDAKHTILTEPWAYYRLNIASVDAATKLYALGSV